MTALVWCDVPDERGPAVVGLVVTRGRVIDGPPYAWRRGWVGVPWDIAGQRLAAAGVTSWWLRDGSGRWVRCGARRRIAEAG